MPVRVAIVTQDDPFYMPLFFEEFFSRVEDADARVERVTILDLLDEGTLSFARRMLSFYGPVNFVRRSVQYASRNIKDILGVGQFSVESMASQHGIPVEHRSDINASEYVEWVSESDIDVLLSVSATQIFNEELLEAPDRFSLNVHTADLPKYRGMLPTFWALYHHEDEIGVTIHTMESEIDKGKIVNQITFPISSQTTLDQAIKQGKREGGKLAAKTIGEIAEGSVSTSEMTGQESYFSFPTKEERREFQRRGRRLI